MNLNLILPLKKITIPRLQREISIPKLGLKHFNMLKDVKGPDENLQLLIDSICPGLSPAESDFVCLHILEFNGKIKSKVEKDGHIYDINDVYICQKLEFQYQGNTFYFRAPGKFEQFPTISHMLNDCFIKVNDSDEKVDFLKMPAFVIKWADDISSTLAIPSPDGPIKGIGKIIGLFDGGQS